jgi:Leucine-rich repeat (LRR) protein
MSLLCEFMRRKVSRVTATNEPSISCFSGRKLGRGTVLLLALTAQFTSVFAGGDDSQFEDLYAALRLNATQLDLRGSDVSDADLQALSNPAFAEVESVLLARTRVTDMGVLHLRNLGVRELDLSHTPISDAGLTHLDGLPLEILDLTGTAVTDAGLVHLSRTPLSRLILRNTAISGDGLTHIDGQAISFLDLSFSLISDTGLAEINRWEQLEIIDLSETAITDQGLLQLCAIPNLTQIHISGTRITQEGRERFQACRPSVRVFSKTPVR